MHRRMCLLRWVLRCSADARCLSRNTTGRAEPDRLNGVNGRWARAVQALPVRVEAEVDAVNAPNALMAYAYRAKRVSLRPCLATSTNTK